MLAGVFALLLMPGLLAASPGSEGVAGKVTEEVVKLSPFEVQARGYDFNKWSCLRSPNFILYTDASPKEADRIVRKMEMLRLAVPFFFKRQNLASLPMRVVLPTGRSDWRKIKSKSYVKWQVALSVMGVLQDTMIVEYDWQENLSPVWGALGHQEANRASVDGPLWFSRGVVGYFSTVQFAGDTLTVGKMGGRAEVVLRQGWMDWSRLFSVTTQSPEFRQDSGAHDIYEGQCYVFTHYLLTAKDPASVPHLLEWAAYLGADNEPTDAAFTKIFGFGFAELQKRISGMLKGGEYATGNIKFPPSLLQYRVDTRTPSASEMRELLVLCQIINQHVAESKVSLEFLLERGLQHHALADLLIAATFRHKLEEAGNDLLLRYVDGSQPNVEAFALASRREIRRLAPKLTVESRIDPSDRIRAWCQKALEIEPRHPSANESLAWVEALAPELSDTSLKVIGKSCRALEGYAPTDNALAALAVARWRVGKTGQARSLAQALVQSPLSRPAVRDLATDLLARIDAEPASASPVGAPMNAEVPPSGSK